ncbi:MAG: hypothetical protein UT63_C0017G0017 [Candidatus Gottesmanbacteria bacterium GW2011_GWC2_39_8]|uniref:Uncharacterized protein n=1 Tax=Candidatus Gottesmanbacteria bacterium GW2011_GWC2_39_8 TaxID=1618450 RepID=A0A0G0Q7W5_9BACT|nr:MAG: hypothetical protein UT63_C0017G0017 [Candidatus Gottesmanbacteria bacterium GW2011_GWC2_39_8]
METCQRGLKLRVSRTSVDRKVVAGIAKIKEGLRRRNENKRKRPVEVFTRTR